MKTLLVSYDLGMPETSDDYRRLIEAIKAYAITWAKPLKSVWFIRTESRVGEVRDHFASFLDSNDKLYVVDVTGMSWATWKVSQEVTDWLKDQNPVGV